MAFLASWRSDKRYTCGYGPTEDLGGLFATAIIAALVADGLHARTDRALRDSVGPPQSFMTMATLPALLLPARP